MFSSLFEAHCSKPSIFVQKLNFWKNLYESEIEFLNPIWIRNDKRIKINEFWSFGPKKISTEKSKFQLWLVLIINQMESKKSTFQRFLENEGTYVWDPHVKKFAMT